MPTSNCHRRGHIVSPPLGRYLATCAQKLTIVSLIYRTGPTTKKWGKRTTKSKKRISSEVSVNSSGNPWVSPKEKKKGYGGKDLQKRKE